MKYRKKPIVIEAEQWFSGKEIEGVENLSSDTESPNGYLYGYIKNPHCEMMICEGDWVLKDIDGYVYGCKSDIFEKTYELVEDPIPDYEGNYL